jgi:hypothetical protein
LTTAAMLNTLMVRTCIKLKVQDMQATRLLAGLNNNDRHTYRASNMNLRPARPSRNVMDRS